MTEREDQELERYLAAARRQPPEPSAALMEQVLGDAFDAQPLPASPALPPTRDRWWSWLAGSAMPAGLAAASLAGLWIGLAAPDLVTAQTAGLMETEFGLELVYRFPAIGSLIGAI